jgi:hypothetical protein
MDVTDRIEEHLEDLERFRWCDQYEREARMLCRPVWYATRHERHMAVISKSIELKIDALSRRW